MRYKLLALASILLIATPLYGQEVSPLIVETLKPTPTVVRTGELFHITYRVRFLNLKASGKEIIVPQEKLPQKGAFIGDFEVIEKVVPFKTEDGNENIWDFVYTLRIINPKKETYKIPKFVIPWYIKQTGQDEGDAKLMDNIKTDEVIITYVTTITDDPYLDIRDSIDFGRFGNLATILRYGPVVFGALILLVVSAQFTTLFRIRRSTKVKTEMVEASSAEVADEELKSASYPGNPRRDFLRGLKILANEVGFGNFLIENLNRPKLNLMNVPLEIERKLSVLVRTLLLAELPELSSANTPGEIYALLKKKNLGRSIKMRILFELSFRLTQYQEDLESEMPTRMIYPPGHVNEIKELMVLGRDLIWHRRTWIFLKTFTPAFLKGANLFGNLFGDKR